MDCGPSDLQLEDLALSSDELDRLFESTSPFSFKDAQADALPQAHLHQPHLHLQPQPQPQLQPMLFTAEELDWLEGDLAPLPSPRGVRSAPYADGGGGGLLQRATPLAGLEAGAAAPPAAFAAADVPRDKNRQQQQQSQRHGRPVDSTGATATATLGACPAATAAATAAGHHRRCFQPQQRENRLSVIEEAVARAAASSVDCAAALKAAHGAGAKATVPGAERRLQDMDEDAVCSLSTEYVLRVFFCLFW